LEFFGWRSEVEEKKGNTQGIAIGLVVLAVAILIGYVLLSAKSPANWNLQAAAPTPAPTKGSVFANATPASTNDDPGCPTDIVGTMLGAQLFKGHAPLSGGGSGPALKACRQPDWARKRASRPRMS